MKFSDGYIKWGIIFEIALGIALEIAVTVASINQGMQVGSDDFESWIVLTIILLTMVIGLTYMCRDDLGSTIIDEKGVRIKSFGKVWKGYSWDDIVECGVCARRAGTYWQFLIFFADRHITEAERYASAGRKLQKGEGQRYFIVISLYTDPLHAVYTYAPPRIIEMFENESYPCNREKLRETYDKYLKEERCLIKSGKNPIM